jgi:preprotein translocase subunit SecD
MAFRPVLTIGNPTPTDTSATPEPTESAAATDPAAPAPTPTPSAAAEEEPSDEPTKAAPDNPSDVAYYVTPAVQAEFDALDCTDSNNLTGGVNGDPDKAFVTCSQDGSAKYILGPVEIEGARISSATSGLNQLPSGGQGNKWVVNIAFDNEGTTQFTDVTTRLQGLAASPPLNQFAMVLDGLVISAPSLDTGVIIADGKAEISGTFTRETAASLANQLNFGSLPLTFDVESEAQISATLGSEQLQKGLLAGLIGLGLVVIYSLFQYRALGLVTVASLVVAGVLTYGIITLLSWLQGYRLSLPGVAGLIVAIGITADSFIVYFERIRDELREGRTLVAAVDRGWERARRTILASDAVNFLAAVVLYVLAVGSVRGFAFTLGLTTLIDVLVVFMFTHPVMQLIARTKFFGQGHRLSGLDPRRLGAPETRYVGRGRVVHGARTSEGEEIQDAVAADETTPRVPVSVGAGTTGLTIAERRAAARAAEQKAGPTDAPVDAPTQDAEPESGRTEGNEH